MSKTVVINVVGLSPSLIGEKTPFLDSLCREWQQQSIEPTLPAVTCTAQSTYLTGCTASEHGIVGNGWLFRDEQEVRFWRQSNRLVESEKIWEQARRRSGRRLKVANLFWWYNMNSSADIEVTPRPLYLADGRKLPDIYTWPHQLRFDLQRDLGTFPLFNFWGPRAGIESSRWIAAAARYIEEREDPDLTLIYLPHLDYNLQRLGPEGIDSTDDLEKIDRLLAGLVAFYEERGAEVVLLSEYGISAVDRPLALNRLLREHGYLAIKEDLGRDYIDFNRSQAFAVADHQLAHIYIQDSKKIDKVRKLIESVNGVEMVLDQSGRRKWGLDHPRSGELVAVADSRSWFSYYYWLDDARAPDFARTVDIHRKPGYDPVELFVDPKIALPQLKAAWRLLQKRLGMRMVMDLIGLDPSLVRGSHGRRPESRDEWPLLLSRRPSKMRRLRGETIQATDVAARLLEIMEGV